MLRNRRARVAGGRRGARGVVIMCITASHFLGEIIRVLGGYENISVYLRNYLLFSLSKIFLFLLFICI